MRARTAELTRATAAAERANAAKTAFLAMISHEIRTPLNGVLGMAEALNDTGLELAQKDMLDVMTASGQALLDYAERKMRAGIAKLKDGEHTFSDVFDGPEFETTLPLSVPTASIRPVAPNSIAVTFPSQPGKISAMRFPSARSTIKTSETFSDHFPLSGARIFATAA